MLRKVLALLLLAVAIVTTQQSIAATVCRPVQSDVCTDSADRIINNVIIHRDCWNYQEKYTCSDDTNVDYCAPLVQAGCFQTNSTCSEKAADGSCAKFTNTYRCNDPSEPTPPNTTKLDTTYTISKDELDESQCAPDATSPYCTQLSEQCVQGPETRIINGVPVYHDCWQYQRDYGCIDPNAVNDCQELIDKGCTMVDKTCISTDDKIGCVANTLRYSCITKKGETNTVVDCSTKTACFDGTCWDNSHPPDGDFALAVAGQEIGREAGVYGEEGTNLFKGVVESCTKGYGGLRNCCKPGTGAQTNNDMLMGVGKSAVTAIGKQAINLGSKYMYDFMYPNGAFSADGMSCINTAFEPTTLSSSVEFYGLGYNFGGEAAVSGMTNVAGGSMTSLGGGFYFDPYSFAIAVAITVITEMMTCDPTEQQLGQHMGANLVHLVGSYCSKKILGACSLTSQVYCSFNSRLGLIINEQARPLIGKSWGTAEAPDCSGFTTDEFQRIDFSKVDLSSFTNDIMDATALPSSTDVTNILAPTIDGITTNDGRYTPQTNAGGKPTGSGAP